MKKFSSMLALILAGVLVFGMTTFAKGSSSSGGGSSSGSSNSDRVDAALAADARNVIATSPLTEEDDGLHLVINPETEATLNESNSVAKSLVSSDAVAITVFDVYLADKNGNWVDCPGPITVTFKNVPGVVAGKSYVIIHKGPNGWEKKATTMNGTELSAVFTSFSPVAIVEVAGNSSAVTSPKTGETMPVAVLLAVICFGGAVFCAKRVSYNQ